MNAFQRGDTIIFTMTPSGLPNVALGVKTTSGDLDCLRFDVTNNLHGGATAKIPGKSDFKGTVTASLDLDAQPWAAPFNVIPGVSAVFFMGISTSKSFQVPIIIGKVHWETSVEKEVTWSFDVEMNILAGNLVFPTQGAN